MTAAAAPYAPIRKAMVNVRRFALLGRRPVMMVSLVVMFMIAAAAPRMFITVPSGHAGVLWLRFFGGTVTRGPALGEGLHVILPWDHIFIYDMRTQATQRTYEVISKDGLHFEIGVTLRWRLLRRTLPMLQQQYGPNYVNVLLLPEIGAVARDRIAQYTTEEVYSFQRSRIQREMYETTVSAERTNAIGPASIRPNDDVNYVSLVDLLITQMNLSPRIRTAIERKVEQLMISEEYQYRLVTEQEEAKRKQIEAEGIQAFQQTVQKGITPSYLKWRGIEATLKLATSPNAKVVVIGGGSGGLPLILNTGDGATPSEVAASSGQSKTARRPNSSLRSDDADSLAEDVNHTVTIPPQASQTRAPAPAAPPAAAPTAPTASAARTTDGAQASHASRVPSLAQALASRLGYRLESLPVGAGQKAQ